LTIDQVSRSGRGGSAKSAPAERIPPRTQYRGSHDLQASMTEDPPEAFIDLDVPRADNGNGHAGPRVPVRLRRRLLGAALTLFCLFALATSGLGSSGLGDPLWTGRVSRDGFVLGTASLYVWSPDGRAMTAFDQVTGQPRWSRTVTDLPDSVMDTGHGVAVVMTRPPSVGGHEPAGTITLVRDATGERIAQTTGDYFMPSADGRRVLVFARQPGGLDGCAGTIACAEGCSGTIACLDGCADAIDCLDANAFSIAAWDTGTGDLAWRLSLAPTARYLTSTVDGRVAVLGERDSDGVVRLRDLSTGSVTATINLSPATVPAGGQTALLVRSWLLAAQPGPDGITLTAYRPPSPSRGWSGVVRDLAASTDTGTGGLFLWECGPNACLTANGISTRVIDLSTASVSPPIASLTVQWLGGVFLASTPPGDTRTGGRGAPNGRLIDAAGRTLSQLTITGSVDWSANDDRGLVTQESRTGTEFDVIDEIGHIRSLGSVPGVGLTCHAHANILACSDPGGTLRVWRLPGG
jgi:hypothetical protein